MAFLRCLQTVSPAGGRRARVRGGVSSGDRSSYRDEYRGEQSSTTELGVPRHAIHHPPTYDPRAIWRVLVRASSVYACAFAPTHTFASREGALPFVRSRSRGEVR